MHLNQLQKSDPNKPILKELKTSRKTKGLSISKGSGDTYPNTDLNSPIKSVMSPLKGSINSSEAKLLIAENTNILPAPRILDPTEIKEVFEKNKQLKEKSKEWNMMVKRNKKHFKKTKRRVHKKSNQIYIDKIDEDAEDYDESMQYYKVLFGDFDDKSENSLYATTPENPNELQPDDELAGEQSIYNLHSKFKKYKRIKEFEMLKQEEPRYPLVEFLMGTDDKRVYPKTLGLIKTKPTAEEYP